MKIKKLLTYIFFMILISTLICIGATQRFTVKGKIINAQTCEPLEGVTVTLHHIENGITDVVTTGSSGKFTKHFTIIGTIKYKCEKPGYMPFDSQVFARIGDNDVGLIPLLREGEPITQVCEEIADTAVGKYLKSLVAEVPEIPEEKGLGAKYEEAKTAIEIQDYDSAIKLLNEELKTHPDNFAINFYLGLCYYQKSEYEKSLEYWIKSSKITSERHVVFRNIAKAYEKSGDRHKAAEYMQTYADKLYEDKEVEIAKKEEAYFETGKYWFNANENDKYFQAFKKVLEINDKNGDAWYFVGMYHFATGKNKECIEAMDKALANNISDENKQTAIALKEAAKTAL
jgi:lipopolysaccharide biosynthesis regulator YciM